MSADKFRKFDGLFAEQINGELSDANFQIFSDEMQSRVTGVLTELGYPMSDPKLKLGNDMILKALYEWVDRDPEHTSIIGDDMIKVISKQILGAARVN